MSDWLANVLTALLMDRRPVDTSESRGFYDKYNTDIPPEKLSAYTAWLLSEGSRQGRDLLMDRGDYDVQGYWLAGERPDERGHGTDDYKKPNHPTFSDESVYHGADGYYGGSWGNNEFVPGKTNLEFRTPEQLAEYFALVEPGVRLPQRTMIPR